MKIFYDKEVDAAYIQLEDIEPEGVVELQEGIDVDTTANNRIIGIEILQASKRVSLSSLFVYEVEPSFALAT